MTTRSWRVLVPVALATMLVVLAAVEPALAQTTTTGGGSTTNIGKNLGKEISSWGQALLFGVAGVVGSVAAARRDVQDAMKIGMIVLVVGGFLFATGSVEAIINALWSTVSQ